MTESETDDTKDSSPIEAPCVASCADCGLAYSAFGVDLVLADQDWKRIAPDDGLLCATCICRRADKVGAVSLLAWIRNS